MSHTPRPSVPAGRSRERAPAFGELPVLDAGGQLVLELHRGLELVHPRPLPVLGEAAAVEIEPGQAERALGVAPGDPHELVVDAQRGGVVGDPSGDRRRHRPEDQLAEHHEVHDTTSGIDVVGGHDLDEFRGREWFELGEGDLDVVERFGDGSEQAGLHRLDAAVRRDGRGDAPRHQAGPLVESEVAAWHVREHCRHVPWVWSPARSGSYVTRPMGVPEDARST